ncbi:unnamed protein product [Rhizophagus irregularis]|nr:unnamed protein product [Rhizophagus irregularis]
MLSRRNWGNRSAKERLAQDDIQKSVDLHKVVDKGDVKDTQKENANKKTTARKGTNTKEAQKNPPQVSKKMTTKSIEIAAKGGKNDADAQKNLAQDDSKIEKNAVIANSQDTKEISEKTKSKKLKKRPTG